MIKLGTTDIASLPGIDKVCLGSDVVYVATPEPTPDHACITFRSSSSNTLTLEKNGSANPTLYYSTDGTTWTAWDGTAISFSSGHPVFLYGNNPSKFSQTTSHFARLLLDGDGNVSCSGNIMTLVDGAGTVTTIPADYYFYRLFYAQSKLIVAPELPATTLKSHCYRQMFQATGITTSPDLPALTLISYCYHYMFRNCSSLNRVKALFTTTPDSTFTNNWLSNVASTGTFIKNANATWTTTGANGIPTGWTVETVTP